MKTRENVSKLKRFNVLKIWDKLKITTKSIIIIIIVSIILPNLFFVLDNFFKLSVDILFNSENPIVDSLMIPLRIFFILPYFIEYHMVAFTYVWLVIRFVPIIGLGYLNGLILEKKFKNIKRKNLYLISSSILIYFLAIGLGVIILDILNLIPLFHKLFVVFEGFGI